MTEVKDLTHGQADDIARKIHNNCRAVSPPGDHCCQIRYWPNGVHLEGRQAHSPSYKPDFQVIAQAKTWIEALHKARKWFTEAGKHE